MGCPRSDQAGVSRIQKEFKQILLVLIQILELGFAAPEQFMIRWGHQQCPSVLGHVPHPSVWMTLRELDEEPVVSAEGSNFCGIAMDRGQVGVVCSVHSWCGTGPVT